MKTNRIAGLALLLGLLAAYRLLAQPADGQVVQAIKAGLLMTCSLQKGASRQSGNNHNPTGLAYYNGPGQRIDRVVMRGNLAHFGTGHPADAAALERVLTHSELVIIGVLQYEPDGRFILVGTILFNGTSYPFRQPAEVAVQPNQQVIERIITLVPVCTPKKFNWLWRTKSQLRVGFMATFPMPPAPGSLTLD